MPDARPAETFDVTRKLAGELLGTTLLLMIVIGSGIMGERLAGGNEAIALLGNTIATGAGLVALITILGPISGAHFNPVVTLAFFLRREIAGRTAVAYLVAQVVGAILGVWAAHLMFGEAVLQVSAKLRNGPAQAFSEAVATFGLLALIFGSVRFRPEATPTLVGLYITSAYWFTASTSFANPAVAVARSLSNTFAGIAPESVPAFIAAEIVGALAATYFFRWLFTSERSSTTDSFPITFFHNPDCGTSRNALAMVRAAGYEPTVIEYLKAGWTIPQLKELLGAMKARPRDILREKGTPAAELGLTAPGVSDDRILAEMIAHPILVNRPIVVTPKGVALARPSEKILDLLERRPASFTKEDGEVVKVSAA